MAISRMQLLKARLPEWVQDWLEVIIPGSQILLILFAAWLLQRMLRPCRRLLCRRLHGRSRAVFGNFGGL